MPRSTTILIRACEASTAAAWAAMLRDETTSVWLFPADVPPEAEVDVLLTDIAEWEREAPGKSVQDAAILRIGATGPADAHLPENVSARELVQVCRLLGEIARLRRRHHAESELRDRLREQAFRDPLTGLPNRRAWDDALRRRLDALDQHAQPLCLAILDLDHFKPVNDTQGHDAGDAVLRAVGRGLVASLRTDDFVARLGGDEFGLLLWVGDAESAAAVVDRVRRRLPEQLRAADAVEVTASAGYRVITPHEALPADPPAAIFTAADASLRLAKHEGRDRTVGGVCS